MDERYELTISEDHATVRLVDRERVADARVFTGARALHDALGVLADWCDRDRAHAGDHPSPCGFPNYIPCICSPDGT